MPDICTRVMMGDTQPKCIQCGTELGAFRYRPMPQWNISGMLCGQCYDKNLTEHYIATDRRNITKK